MSRKPRLELTWPGKDERPRLEPRVLVEDEALSYHAGKRFGAGDQFDNLLIQGDNLLALEALRADFAGKVKCVYIDPPYNTGSAFEHYDDGIEHSLWLSLLRDRLELLHSLLSEDGVLWLNLDDNEVHYAKVICDEVFGRANFVSMVVWQKKYTIANDAIWFSDNHDLLLVYARNKAVWRPNLLPRTEAMNARYSNPDEHPKGPWKITPLHAKSGGPSSMYTFTFKNGVRWNPPSGTYARYSRENLEAMDLRDEIWFGAQGTAIPSRKTFLCDLKRSGTPSPTVWLAAEVGHNHEAKSEAKAFVSEIVPFATPKPERLIERILTIATNPGDLVLDSFLGSGTTAAVAHKMGRRWIGVELGDHAVTHCVPRLRKVIDGEDPGGVTASNNWKGGGGFRFYRLAPTLLKRDAWNQWVINPELPAEVLIQAVCKIEGYRYEPDPERFWVHGRASEQAYLYVTTQHLSAEQLLDLSRKVGDDAGLLVCCMAFTPPAKMPDNLEVKKLPISLANRCDWDRDDYSLRIAALPKADGDEDDATAGDDSAKPRKRGRKKKAAPAQQALFGAAADADDGDEGSDAESDDDEDGGVA